MKRLIIPIFLAVILILGSLLWWKENSQPVSSDEEMQSFVIPRGYSALQTGNKLSNQGLIKSSLAFKFYVQLTAQSKKIQAGEYLLSPSFSLFEIVSQLTKGPREIWITIPEGLRREEIANKYLTSLNKTGSEAVEFRQEFLSSTTGKEGYLFPDTYLFPKTASASAIANKMLSTFDLKIDSEMEEAINNSGYNLNQIITLASLLERETITNEERPVVAGILWKRVEAGWPLQVDAAVQYAIATADCQGKIECEWWPILTKEDLAINSSYNTYKYPGLPPAPIASPGLSSIKAAIFPEDSPYWFYLHDADGEIHYAETLEEHNANVSRYLGK
ncbi:MAG: endolytic transglycosylase MltG [Patescibacteria group bacterium]